MQSRLDRLLETTGGGCAIFINGFPNILYYSGFTSGDAYLLISRSAQYIVTDSRYFIQAKIQAPDFELIDIKKGWQYIFGSVTEQDICFEENMLTYAMYSTLQKQLPDRTLVPAQSQIDKPRQMKSAAEIAAVREAEAIGDKAFAYILEKLHVGMSERDVAIELEMYMRRLGASGVSFETIVASGLRSAMPHGTASGKLIGRGDFVTMDFGCIYNGYCSDMTRTVVMGTPDSRQREVYSLVLAAQTAVIDGLSGGMKCSSADKLARDIIADGGYGEYFTHSLGHSVGIEIHESPTFSPGSEDTLSDGNVMSVEPGIYIDGWGGVRIEDVIAVENGCIANLTTSPKELIVI